MKLFEFPSFCYNDLRVWQHCARSHMRLSEGIAATADLICSILTRYILGQVTPRRPAFPARCRETRIHFIGCQLGSPSM